MKLTNQSIYLDRRYPYPPLNPLPKYNRWQRIYIYTLQFFVEELIRKKRGGKRLGRLWPSLSHKRRSSRGTGAVRVHVSRSKKRNDTMKYVLVTGGVVSGLGKGVTASSIGVVLKACGLRVTCIKIGSLSTPFSFLFIFFHKSLLILVQIHDMKSNNKTLSCTWTFVF